VFIKSGCKINLGLQIVEKRVDGYHNINSVFFPVMWQDLIEVIVMPQQIDPIILKTSGINIESHAQSNTIYKLLTLIKQNYSIPPLHVHLHKCIPMGAGLGGGSANAAEVLKYLKCHFLNTLTDTEAELLLSKIGSDCVFFWNAKPALIRGTGTQSHAFPISLNGYFLVLIYPYINISTAWAYAHCVPKPAEIDIEEILTKPLNTWKDVLHNDFEEPVFKAYPLLGQIKQNLYKKGAVYASLSGSGSTLYGIFKEIPDLSEFANYRCFTQTLQ
jgi:4-diphosphocytidyl-2-C-methyl-D-erythritol kinase